MRDVATAAGVGLATVSRVFSGAPGVRPEVAERVTAAALRLGYRRDAAASSLRRADRRSGTVGLIMADVANPFAAVLHRAVEDAAVTRGVLVLAGSSDESAERELAVIEAFRSRRVDALIVMPSGGTDAALAEMCAQGTPVVSVDRPLEVPAARSVVADNRGGARRAVSRLRALGHRRIAFLGDRPDLWTARERLAGYTEAMGGEVDPALVVRGLAGAEQGEQATQRLLALPHPPTALFTAQNLLTTGARRALQDRGEQRLVAHVGFDDLPLGDLLDPPVSVVAQDPARMGAIAARAAFALLDGDGGIPPCTVLRTQYLARGSGEIPPGLRAG
ncbi:LacI family DNA-binding transcriptional regulator [Streptomyces sp. NPDC056580]|uniref:LacI family DNA-binding transcriptional regulator n=1 Tax=Streptomyces sp. NPDC056580 TaxID=3345872 RepID=UPI00367E9635